VQFLAKNRVVSPAIYVYEASIFQRLASENNHTLKNRTSEPTPTARNNYQPTSQPWPLLAEMAPERQYPPPKERGRDH